MDIFCKYRTYNGSLLSCNGSLLTSDWSVLDMWEVLSANSGCPMVLFWHVIGLFWHGMGLFWHVMGVFWHMMGLFWFAVSSIRKYWTSNGSLLTSSGSLWPVGGAFRKPLGLMHCVLQCVAEELRAEPWAACVGISDINLGVCWYIHICVPMTYIGTYILSYVGTINIGVCGYPYVCAPMGYRHMWIHICWRTWVPMEYRRM